MFLNKSKNVIFFKFWKKDFFQNLKLLIFLKKKNIFFRSGSSLSKKVKNNFLLKNQVLKNQDLKNSFKSFSFHKTLLYNFKFNFNLALKSNTDLIKKFFLKKKILKKSLIKFFKKISKKSFIVQNKFESILFLNLLKSHFFFFSYDTQFFLKKKFIYVNGFIQTNPFYILKIGDRIQLSISDQYFIYIKGIFNFFKRKAFIIKKKEWTSFKENNPGIYNKWEPSFFKNLLFFKLDTPSYLEIDFLTLTFVYLKVEKNLEKKKSFFFKFFSHFLLKSYNWKKIT